MDAPKFLIPSLEGVTVAIVAFLLVCLALPHLIKNKTHWYVAFFSVLCIILLQTATMMFAQTGVVVVFGALTGFLQVIALIMLVLAVGGLSPRELGADMLKTIEVIRRGEEKKQVIVPLTREQPAERVRTSDIGDDARTIFKIDESDDDVSIPRKPSTPPDEPKGPIPLG